MADTRAQHGVAVISAGYWGKNLTRTFHQLGALAAVVETNLERRSAMAAAYPGVQIFDAPDPALSNPAITAVAIATPAETHSDLVAQTLKAGKHVCVKKPLAWASRWTWS